ncbi:competence/damage-inducible protein A [Chelatococcus sambhunathii]|uniref:Competence/damage-inducible protein A n=1 Tax=Chelatococcus sambhunathii TaxID=363953 RepID=A0ABU1DBR9_9HYPH|nr:molybdopterin-binding protein [Chelatococcus sambhunathii]MDR4305515.1 competence/damage-inducible protein A [Chelatococcus sambhunathii]
MDTPANTVTAAIVVIGDEILSGRTQDTNSGDIARALGAVGIDVTEIRVVSDEEPAIVEAVNALRAQNSYVFTCGGIGPTHDDKTADAIAAAFGVGIDFDERAIAMMRERFPNPADLNEGRMRMTRIPFGAELIANSVSKAPGFHIGNVFVMAGVPSIMRAMLAEVVPLLRSGVPTSSESLRADIKEGDLAMPLAALQKQHPSVSIGSYPFNDGDRYGSNLVLRSRDTHALADAMAAVEAMLKTLT